MADTIREQLLSALVTRLKAIKTTGGYVTNLGNNVYHHRAGELAESELPGAVIRDLKSDIEPRVGAVEHTLDIEISVVVAAGATSIQTVYDLIADVYKAIGTDDRWGGLAIDTVPLGDTVEVVQDDLTIAGATIRIEIEYETNKWTL